MEEWYSFDTIDGYSVGVETLIQSDHSFCYQAQVYLNGNCVHTGKIKQSGELARSEAIKWVACDVKDKSTSEGMV